MYIVLIRMYSHHWLCSNTVVNCICTHIQTESKKVVELIELALEKNISFRSNTGKYQRCIDAIATRKKLLRGERFILFIIHRKNAKIEKGARRLSLSKLDLLSWSIVILLRLGCRGASAFNGL